MPDNLKLIRQVKENDDGLLPHGVDEIIPYKVTVPASWGTPATPVTVTVLDEQGWGAEAGMVEGMPTISGQDISPITIISPKGGHVYRVRVGFSVNSKPRSCYFRIQGEE